MKIIFDYQGEKVYILIKNYYSLWELLECIEQQLGVNEISVKYSKLNKRSKR
jgi:hypothetical protein